LRDYTLHRERRSARLYGALLLLLAAMKTIDHFRGEHGFLSNPTCTRRLFDAFYVMEKG